MWGWEVTSTRLALCYFSAQRIILWAYIYVRSTTHKTPQSYSHLHTPHYTPQIYPIRQPHTKYDSTRYIILCDVLFRMICNSSRWWFDTILICAKYYWLYDIIFNKDAIAYMMIIHINCTTHDFAQHTILQDIWFRKIHNLIKRTITQET